MLNREKYANEIIDIAARSRLALKNGRPMKCLGTPCEECDFYSLAGCATEVTRWLNAEYVEPSVDWSKVPVDTPILVRNSEIEPWRKRYYAGPGNRSVYAWNAGATSWNAEGRGHWKYAKLAEREGADV